MEIKFPLESRCTALDKLRDVDHLLFNSEGFVRASFVFAGCLCKDSMRIYNLV